MEVKSSGIVFWAEYDVRLLYLQAGWGCTSVMELWQISTLVYSDENHFLIFVKTMGGAFNALGLLFPLVFSLHIL